MLRELFIGARFARCLVGLCVMWLAGCVTARPQGATLPQSGTVARGQLVIHCDFPLSEKHPLLDELDALRGDVAGRLDLPPTQEPIHIFLYQSRKAYEAYAREHFPAFAQRRALFVESESQLAVYAFWGDRAAEDLRHEVTHGYLHAAIPHLPLWIDEGLAKYFEVGRGTEGYNAPLVAVLRTEAARKKWTPNLPRLEQLPSAAQMSLVDYAESWLWVHLLLHTSEENRAVLLTYLHGLRAEGTTPPLSQLVARTIPDPNAALLAHLRSLKK